MLSKCVLFNPPRGGRCHWQSTLKLIASRIQARREGRYMELWGEATGGQTRRSKMKSSSAESLYRSNISRARCAVANGQYKKALQCLTSTGIASPSSEVFNDLLAQHPQADLPFIPPTSHSLPIQASMEDVSKALKSFPPGSAPGPSSLCANHFKQAIRCPSSDRANKVLHSLTGVVNLLCAGNVPPSVIPHLCWDLLPCLKKSGGLRPIAIGEVLRRLT